MLSRSLLAKGHTIHWRRHRYERHGNCGTTFKAVYGKERYFG